MGAITSMYTQPNKDVKKDISCLNTEMEPIWQHFHQTPTHSHTHTSLPSWNRNPGCTVWRSLLHCVIPAIISLLWGTVLDHNCMHGRTEKNIFPCLKFQRCRMWLVGAWSIQNPVVPTEPCANRTPCNCSPVQCSQGLEPVTSLQP